jgi:hypothetical protein
VGFWRSYKLRWQRRGQLWSAARRRRELSHASNRTAQIGAQDILLFCTLRNERLRLPYFLSYYRNLGVDHFLFVDNGSDDGSREYLAEQKDCSVWTTTASYRDASFGMDWINALLRRYAHGHWAVVVDVDEFLVYPFLDTRPLRALTDWLDDSGIRSFGTLLVDMYPKGPFAAQPLAEGQNPMEIAAWFDSANYTLRRNPRLRNLWIQGGPRMRVFFADTPEKAPALNKIPVVKWHRSYAYVSSTHMLLPRGLNLVYDVAGGEKASGCLLHAKFLATLDEKAREELARGQHYGDSREYQAYFAGIEAETDLWCRWSERFINWRQLEIMGLMSKGNWA